MYKYSFIAVLALGIAAFSNNARAMNWDCLEKCTNDLVTCNHQCNNPKEKGAKACSESCLEKYKSCSQNCAG